MMSFGESGCIFLQGGVMGPFHPSKILLWKHCGCVEFSAPGFDALKSFGCICLQGGVLPTGRWLHQKLAILPVKSSPLLDI